MCEEEQIDAHFHKGGILGLARGVHQLPIIRSAYASCQRSGSAIIITCCPQTSWPST